MISSGEILEKPLLIGFNFNSINIPVFTYAALVNLGVIIRSSLKFSLIRIFQKHPIPPHPL